ncbi:MAG: DUF445 domain-containing protein [Pseudomonadota bacterium]
MAASSGDSKEVTVSPRRLDEPAWNAAAHARAAEYARMRWIATGLLVLMLAVFVATGQLVDRWPWLAYARAFAEAAMVGAVADWFAVVALFRRPFGLPIPHTAIIPRNKQRIGDSLGAFICNNFLAPDVVSAKLDSLDPAGRLARWLARPENAARAARRASGVVPPLLEALEDDRVRGFLHGAVRRGLAAVDAAPLASRVLAVLVAHGHHQALFDRLIVAGEGFLARNEGLIRARVADRSWRWLPRWVDEKLADKVVFGLADTLRELHDPGHPWRRDFQVAAESWVARLAEDPDWRARGEAIKAEVMDNPALEGYLDSLWEEIKRRLRSDAAQDQGVLQGGLERALLALGERLEADPAMRAVANRWLRVAVQRHVIPHRGEIGGFIAGVVARWDTTTLVGKLELQVGKDLQYIRINGTIVGGLVGLLIYVVGGWLG